MKKLLIVVFVAVAFVCNFVSGADRQHLVNDRRELGQERYERTRLRLIESKLVQRSESSGNSVPEAAAALAARAVDLDRREKEVWQVIAGELFELKRKQLEEQEADFQWRMAEATKKEEDSLAIRKAELDRRKAELDRREASLDRRDVALDRREAGDRRGAPMGRGAAVGAASNFDLGYLYETPSERSLIDQRRARLQSLWNPRN